MKLATNQKGYIALMSAIVIMFLLLAITVSLGLSSFFVRLNIVDSESKERSSAAAEACVDTAIVNIAQGAIQPTSPVTVGKDSCTITSVSVSGSNTTIKTQSVVNRAYTNLKVVIDTNSLTVISWDECEVMGTCL